MTIIERAAQAAYAALVDQNRDSAIAFLDDAEDLTDVRVDGSVDLAAVVRAVLAAIREPSEGMRQAVRNMLERESMYMDCGLDEVWHLMIDAALADEP